MGIELGAPGAAGGLDVEAVAPCAPGIAPGAPGIAPGAPGIAAGATCVFAAGGLFAAGGGVDDPHPISADAARDAVQHHIVRDCFKNGMAIRRFLFIVSRTEGELISEVVIGYLFDDAHLSARGEFRGVRTATIPGMMSFSQTFRKLFSSRSLGGVPN